MSADTDSGPSNPEATSARFFVDYVDDHTPPIEGDLTETVGEFRLFVEDQFVPVDRVVFKKIDSLAYGYTYEINLHSPLVRAGVPVIQVAWDEEDGFHRFDDGSGDFIPVDEKRAKDLVTKLQAAESVGVLLPKE